MTHSATRHYDMLTPADQYGHVRQRLWNVPEGKRELTEGEVAAVAQLAADMEKAVKE